MIARHQFALLQELKDTASGFLWHVCANEEMKDRLPLFCCVDIEEGYVDMVLVSCFTRHAKRTGVSPAS